LVALCGTVVGVVIEDRVAPEGEDNVRSTGIQPLLNSITFPNSFGQADQSANDSSPILAAG